MNLRQLFGKGHASQADLGALSYTVLRDRETNSRRYSDLRQRQRGNESQLSEVGQSLQDLWNSAKYNHNDMKETVNRNFDGIDEAFEEIDGAFGILDERQEIIGRSLLILIDAVSRLAAEAGVTDLVSPENVEWINGTMRDMISSGDDTVDLADENNEYETEGDHVHSFTLEEIDELLGFGPTVFGETTTGYQLPNEGLGLVIDEAAYVPNDGTSQEYYGVPTTEPGPTPSAGGGNGSYVAGEPTEAQAADGSGTGGTEDPDHHEIGRWGTESPAFGRQPNASDI